MQSLVGNLDVKTKNVHFYVQRSRNFGIAKAVIPFESARVNEGNAMNVISGIFTVPIAGIYHFQFSAVKDKSVAYLAIHLQVNGVTVGEAPTNQPTAGSYDGVSLSASLRLAANDRVNLYNLKGVLHENRNAPMTHFSGWLVEEEFI